MRILYDGVAFQNAHQRGIQRYFTELLSRLPEEARVTIAFSGAPKVRLPERARVVRADLRLNSVFPRAARPTLARSVAGPRTRRLARSHDVFHSTYYTMPPNRRIPAIITVYDMIAERFPGSYPSRAAEREVARKRAAIVAADRIIAISEDSARALAATYPELAGRVRAIPLGHEHLLRRAVSSNPGGPQELTGGRPYALFVGDRAGYKNFRVVFKAASTPEWPRDVLLVVVGSPWKAEEAEFIEKHGLGQRIRLVGRIGDERLTTLYLGAGCVIVPSLAEGFGFPVVEAQAAGAPVVCSDTPVFREVAGAAALFFDPARPDRLASEIEEALKTETGERLRAASRVNLRRFRWDQCARETWAVYQNALEVAGAHTLR